MICTDMQACAPQHRWNSVPTLFPGKVRSHDSNAHSTLCQHRFHFPRWMLLRRTLRLSFPCPLRSSTMLDGRWCHLQHRSYYSNRYKWTSGNDLRWTSPNRTRCRKLFPSRSIVHFRMLSTRSPRSIDWYLRNHASILPRCRLLDQLRSQ